MRTILAIETSCDETAAAVVAEDYTILSNVIASQIATHAKFGGVVPEIASRAHIEAIQWVTAQALGEAGLTIAEVDAIAVTEGPGLVGALLTGVNFAKGLAFAAGKPLYRVQHIAGHIAANRLAQPDLLPPYICLVVSGGHTQILYVEETGAFRLLGQTLDDAAGEAFDKAARMIGLPYPGGPLLDVLAETGDPSALKLPQAKVSGAFDFSFSGLKTALFQRLKALENATDRPSDADIAASFRHAVVTPLVAKTIRAALDMGVPTVAMAGGVAANRLLRRRMAEAASANGLHLVMPPMELCTDNAAMIAAAAWAHPRTADWHLNATPTLLL